MDQIGILDEFNGIINELKEVGIKYKVMYDAMGVTNQHTPQCALKKPIY